MKLLRVGVKGKEKPAALDKNGKIRDLSTHITDLNSDTVNFKTIKKLESIDLENLPEISNSERIGPCINKPGKFVAIGLTKSIAADFVKHNIRCNSIAPGTVFSPSWQDRVNQSPDPVQAKKDFIARQPMGRLGTAEEIAAVAVYLAGDDATFTTGTTISVDGGISI